MIGCSAATSTWHVILACHLLLLCVLELAAAAPLSAPTLSDEEVRQAEEEARLADEAADLKRCMLVGAGCAGLLIILFCIWLAAICMYGRLYGFRPCETIQEACHAEHAAVSVDSVAFTCPPSPVKPAAVEAAKETPCETEEDCWKVPRDDDSPGELAKSWVGMIPLQAEEEQKAAIAAAEQGGATAALSAETAEEERQLISSAGWPPGWALEEAEAGCEHKKNEQDVHRAASLQRGMEGSSSGELPRSPPPTSLCWNSCVALVCCSVANSTRSL